MGTTDSTKRLMLTAAGALAISAALAVARRGTFTMRGKVVLITGGSRGLGLVMARQLAREGARIAICARDAVELERARTELAQHGAEVLAIPCDVSNKAQVAAMIDAVDEELGPVDVLINNAGVIQVGPMDLMLEEDYAEAMGVHFWGPLHTTLAVLPDMRRRRAGRIVNIASIGGKISVPHLVPYSASKFALVGLSEGMRAELAEDGVKVTTVCPGLMRTGSPRNAWFKGRHRAEYAWFSISDSLPGLSISAERAARQIIEACKRGDAEVVLSLPAKIAVKAQGLAPGFVAGAMALVNRLLPGPDGIGTERVKGADSQSVVSPSWLTFLTERAAKRNNEMGAPLETPPKNGG